MEALNLVNINTSTACLRALTYITMYISAQAVKLGLTYPRYAWLIYGWYQDRWWTGAVDSNMVDCTDQQLATFLERALVLQIFPSSEDPTAPTDTGLVLYIHNNAYAR